MSAPCIDHQLPDCPHSVCRADTNHRTTYLEETVMFTCTRHRRRDCRESVCRPERARDETAKASRTTELADPVSPLHQATYGGAFYGSTSSGTGSSSCDTSSSGGSSSSYDSGSSGSSSSDCGGGY